MLDFVRVIDTLHEARRQLEYMDERSPSGTTPAVIARIDDVLLSGPSSPALSEVERMIVELESAARSASRASRMLAEAKSLRQTDNPEGRKDLYMWATPEQTTEGRAAVMLRQLVGSGQRMLDTARTQL